MCSTAVWWFGDEDGDKDAFVGDFEQLERDDYSDRDIVSRFHNDWFGK